MSSVVLVENQVQVRSLDNLKHKIKDAMNQMAQNAIDIGTWLREAKEQVPHGEWQNWLESNFNLKKSSAANFMNIAQRFGGNFQTFGNLGYSQMLNLLALPEGEKESFIQEQEAKGKPVQNMTVKELRGEIKKRKRISTKKRGAESSGNFQTFGNLNQTKETQPEESDTILKLREENATLADKVMEQQVEIEELRARLSEQEKKVEAQKKEINTYEEQEYNTGVIDKFNTFCNQLYKRNPDVRRVIDSEGNEGLVRFISQSFFYEHIQHILWKRGIRLPQEPP